MKVDGKKRAAGDRAGGGEEIALGAFVVRAAASVAAADDPRAAVLYEDDALLALSKPSGMPCAPLRHGEPGTLLGAAIARAPAIEKAGPPLEGGLLHRLDRDTSGVVLFAKNEATREVMRQAFADHAIEKRYFALVLDPGLEDRFTVQSWIAQAGERVKVVPPSTPGGLFAGTDF